MAKKKKTRKYEVLGGTHVEGGRKVYHKGDVIESDKDLVRLFKNKFKEVDPDTPTGHSAMLGRGLDPETSKALAKAAEKKEKEERKKAEKAAEKAKKEEADESDESDGTEEVDLGQDVTSSFEDELTDGFQVFRKNKKYTVVKKGETESLHEGVLRNKPMVESFLEDQQPEEDDEEDDEDETADDDED